jgi:hypothetical protein
MRNRLAKALLASLLLLTSLTLNPSSAVAEECPAVDLAKYGLKVQSIWKPENKVRVITWASNAKVIGPDELSQPFTATEEAWLVEAINSWGSVLDSIAFVKVDGSQSPMLSIGYTKLTGGTYPTATTGGTFGLWAAKPEINKAIIRLLDSAHQYQGFDLFATRENFIKALQNEIGNVLGVSDYPLKELGPGSYVTIFDNSKSKKYGQVELNDLDASIIRQAYGESTCPSAFSATARVANLVADAETGAAFLNPVKVTPTPAPSASASTTPAPSASASPAIKSTTITCVKGKTSKKVSGANPKCPTGYVKK